MALARAERWMAAQARFDAEGDMVVRPLETGLAVPTCPHCGAGLVAQLLYVATLTRTGATAAGQLPGRGQGNDGSLPAA